MATIPDHYREMLEFAARNFQKILRAEAAEDANIVQKGLLHYRQGMVYKMKLEDEAVIASVQDVAPVDVRLDLNFLETSGCSCPAEGFCRHQLAVFFQAYSTIGSVADWLEEWRQPIKEKALASKWGLKRAKDLLKRSAKLKASYENWIGTFEDSFKSIMTGMGEPRPYVVPELFQIYMKRLNASSPIEQEWKNLYELCASVFTFLKLAEISEKYGHTDEMVNRYYRHVFHSLIEKAMDAVDRLSIHSLPFAFDQFIEKLKDNTGELLFVPEFLKYEGIHLYRVLWDGLFKQSKWREEERASLTELVKRNGSLPPAIALAHLNMLIRKDEEAILGLQRLGTDAVPYMIHWLELLTAQKAWKRMTPYAELFILQLNKYTKTLIGYHKRRDFTNLAIDVLTPFCVESSRYDLYERALLQTLPYSYREYEDFLFQQGQLEKWGELQSYIGFDVRDLPTDRIKTVQKEKPEILLPLYHQSIVRNIEMKNRTNYREAVRHLKKLRTIYKKMKRLEDFERFMAELMKKTKRLRAFQEECKRGKLIDV
ncbi:SWIM zinc finger family protein [Bacillus methanolicus]|uniref:SWIM-type domain-containing protein n=1 Tax=Bacillus methanolicus (strain MGA3 / ATCC 53907) TaxID=796606 RepID=I3EBF8_BACMM|nr:hypothetical protein [Bacillus methanolicus]AIE61510.1 hypothetical protein BMMGA3_15785 [Bacillus methanolicus MGA3]EIJ83829.1 hypothetical protein MGA3_01000 [Bacillus methanolicus MGA3]